MRTLLERLYVRSSNRMLAKVAILDTGCDMSNEYIQAHTKEGEGGRIHDCWDFTDNQRDPKSDKTGHGTHMAHLIFKVAQHVELYIARVWDGKEVSETPSRIAAVGLLLCRDALKVLISRQAITHAVTSWNVDIISLSLSLRISSKRSMVKDALSLAKNNNVIVFAAASNNRHNFNNEIGFPAALDEFTICINSHNGSFDRSGFSPRPKTDRANLAILGEGIEAAWKDNTIIRTKGTSISTIIAAGVGAIVLDYAM